MDLRKLIFTKNECYTAGRTIVVKGIMVHSTGANNPTLRRYVGPDDGALGANTSNNHWNQARPDGRQVCVHGFIGKLANGNIATYQTLPWNHRGWHAGGSANDTHIGFEICEDATTDATYFNLVYKEAVELCAYLCKEYKLNPLADGVLICHSEGFKRGVASNHGDVMHWFPKHGKSMDTFRQDVAKIVNSGTTTTPTTPTQPTTDEMYRVRKTWADSASQKGAFSSLENAKICANENPDYNVYNSKGELVYSTQTTAPAPTQPAKSNDETIWNFLKSKALNDFAIAGIMGNLFAESGLVPNNVQGSWKQSNASQYNADYTAKVDNGQIDFVNDKTGGGGYGLAQWTYYTRKQGLLDFAKASKTSIGDLTMQLNYLWKELQGYTVMMNTLKNATSVLQASNAILFDFERPADQGASVQSTRASYGQGYYDKFATKVTTSTKTVEEITVENAVKDGIIASPDHWLAVLTGKQAANPEYIRTVFEKYNAALLTKTAEEIAIDGAIANGIVTSPDYWLEVLQGKQQPNLEWLRLVFERYHDKLSTK